MLSIERYLGAYRPIFHRRSITRRKLLTLLAIIVISSAIICIISRNGLAFSFSMGLLILLDLYSPIFMFVNLKLFILARKLHRERVISQGKKKTINFKSISTGLWAVACTMLLSIPSSVYISFKRAGKSTNILAFFWAITCITMNSTFNSLISFWKNNVLRSEGIKILKTLKNRLIGS